MVFVTVPEGTHRRLAEHCRERDILLYAPSRQLRLVTHLDVSADDVDRVAEAFAEFFA
jgi:threonine aldolase